MPELTDEQLQAKIAEATESKLKELGFDDHAKKVIERTNSEAKANRERAEKAEAEAKALKDEADKRKAEDAKRQEEVEAEKKRIEDEKKSDIERLTATVNELKDTLKRELTKNEKAAAQAQQQYLDDLKARDAQVLMLAVEAAAKERGIVDPELVKLLDVSEIPIEKGIPDREKISELIEEHAKAKPHLYKEPDQTQRDERGRFTNTRPDPASQKRANDAKTDARQLPPDQYKAMEERFRSGRVA